MHLWPRSMAGRTSVVLIAGMLVILFSGAAVWGIAALFGSAGPRGPMLVEGIATFVTIIDRLPPPERQRALADLRPGRFHVQWSRKRETRVPVERHRLSAWIENRLRQALAPYGIDLVQLGMTRGDPPAGPPVAIAIVRLSDGSWLIFTHPDDWHGVSHLIQVFAVILVVAGGIVGLGIWVSHKVTSPLNRFADAAARLGTDVDAAPMAETGPSEIREAAQAFNRMQDRIKRFLEDRTLMMAAISHDLRTVLTRLRLRAEYIEDGTQQAKAFADLDEMGAMLAETLAFFHDDAVSETQSRVNLAALLQTLCDDLADSGVAAYFEGPRHLTFACRPLALRRALSNLMVNAAKFGEAAEVSLAEEDSSAVITVADRGPGIADALKEKVFQPFFRVEESRSRETGGSGLGLAVARTIVRSHGGDITLSERPGGGLLARVTLPNAAPEEERQA